MQDDNASKPAEFDRDLQLWYRAQAEENASAELDDAIMTLAKSAVEKWRIIILLLKAVFGVAIAGQFHQQLR